jgi:hypothetical protein
LRRPATAFELALQGAEEQLEQPVVGILGVELVRVSASGP